MLESFLPGGFTLLKWFPLGPPRTKCVSVCKTKHSRAEVLISVAEGGGGFVTSVRVIFLLQNKYFLCSPLGAQTTTFVVSEGRAAIKVLDS